MSVGVSARDEEERFYSGEKWGLSSRVTRLGLFFFTSSLLNIYTKNPVTRSSHLKKRKKKKKKEKRMVLMRRSELA